MCHQHGAARPAPRGSRGPAAVLREPPGGGCRHVTGAEPLRARGSSRLPAPSGGAEAPACPKQLRPRGKRVGVTRGLREPPRACGSLPGPAETPRAAAARERAGDERESRASLCPLIGRCRRRALATGGERGIVAIGQTPRHNSDSDWRKERSWLLIGSEEEPGSFPFRRELTLWRRGGGGRPVSPGRSHGGLLAAGRAQVPGAAAGRGLARRAGGVAAVPREGAGKRLGRARARVSPSFCCRSCPRAVATSGTRRSAPRRLEQP